MADTNTPRFDRRFWKISGAGAAFQAGSSTVDSATIVASLVNHLTGSVFAVGAASAILRLGWLIPQLIVGFLAQQSDRRMPYYIFGAFGRAAMLGLIAVLLFMLANAPAAWLAAGFFLLWTAYAFISGIVAVPYNDIVGRSIISGARSRMLALRFFGGGILTLGIAAVIHRLLATQPTLTAYAAIFALASVLMVISSVSFVSAGEPPAPASGGDAHHRFNDFLKGGLDVYRSDRRFRLFLFTQWLGGATFMALPFYVVAASRMGVEGADIAILLGAQTAGSLASNGLWGRVGDAQGKLRLLQWVGGLRFAVPLAAALLLPWVAAHSGWGLIAFAALFAAIGALVNGMTIGYLGFLMEISPDARRPAYSAYFNALASPAALAPLVGAALAGALSLQALFGVAAFAAVLQLGLYAKLARLENG